MKDKKNTSGILNYDLITKYLTLFLQEETYKIGLNGGLLGLSGGIDSALVAVLSKKAFGSEFLAVMMPSKYSNDTHFQDAKDLCEAFDIDYIIEPIDGLLDVYSSKMDDDKLRIGNFCARIRMIMLYDLSQKYSKLVIGTSNKSELLLGYSTIFGDIASAINPIGDLYKSEVFEYSRFLGISENIIKKPPSADLWEAQSDEDDLGYKYNQIDEFLEQMIENEKTNQQLEEYGFDKIMIKSLSSRVYKNQFKRQPPLIAKLREKTIGIDFLMARDIGL